MNLRKDHYRFSSLGGRSETKTSGALLCLATSACLLMSARSAIWALAAIWLLKTRPTARTEVLCASVVPPVKGAEGDNTALKSLASGSGCCSPPLVDSCGKRLQSQTFQASVPWKTQIQHYTVDHLARGSMKNGANSVTQCELQDT